jgi:hypothetical protein
MYPVLVNPAVVIITGFLVYFLSPSIRFCLVLDCKLAATLFFFSTLLTTPTVHPVTLRELVRNKSSLQCFYVTSADTS